MPEMPEVETVVRSLRRRLVGARIRSAEILDPKLAALDVSALRGRTIRAVERSGKEIVLDLSTPRRPLRLCVHLRMTGRLFFTETEPPCAANHLRFLARLDRGLLLFDDARRFGVLRLAHAPEEWAAPGVEILSDAFTPTRLKELIGRSAMPIKTWLLRQDRLVGFGNIYASEVCFAAGIDPRRPAASLTLAEITRVQRVTRRIFAAAVAHGGTTISDFQDCEGTRGGYALFLKVYGRAGEPCRRRSCSGVIERIVQAGRSTFFCPRCQS